MRYQYLKAIEFPLILGREFCGEVVQSGMGVDKIAVGDRVYGVVPLHVNGSHAQYVVVPEYCVIIQKYIFKLIILKYLYFSCQ